MSESTTQSAPEPTPVQVKLKRRRRIWLIVLGAIAVLVIFMYPKVDAALDILRSGVLDKPEQRKYEGSSIDNLKNLRVALMAYHDSEEHFPESSAWMTAIENRIQTRDMSREEAEKKLIRPDLKDKPGEFGYAINDAVSNKYKDDIPTKDNTILLFESPLVGRNAHGDPAKDRQGLAITVGGEILRK